MSKDIALIVRANILVEWKERSFFLTLSSLSEVRETEITTNIKPLLTLFYKNLIGEKEFYSLSKEIIERLGGLSLKNDEIRKALINTVENEKETLPQDIFTLVVETTAPPIWRKIKEKISIKPSLSITSFDIRYTHEDELFYSFIFTTLSYHDIYKHIYLDTNPLYAEMAQQQGLNSLIYVKGKKLEDYKQLLKI